MKYLCLIYSDETRWMKMPKGDADTMLSEYGEFSQSIQKSGHFQAGHRLEPTHTATTIRIRNGKTSTTDGPFAETKEQLGGYYLIEAAYQRALALTKQQPERRFLERRLADLGSVQQTTWLREEGTSETT